MVTDLTPTMMWEEPTDADDGLASVGIGAPNVSSMKNAVATMLPMNSTNSRSIVSYDVYVSTDDVFMDVICSDSRNQQLYSRYGFSRRYDVLLEGSSYG